MSINNSLEYDSMFDDDSSNHNDNDNDDDDENTCLLEYDSMSAGNSSVDDSSEHATITQEQLQDFPQQDQDQDHYESQYLYSSSLNKEPASHRHVHINNTMKFHGRTSSSFDSSSDMNHLSSNHCTEGIGHTQSDDNDKTEKRSFSSLVSIIQQQRKHTLQSNSRPNIQLKDSLRSSTPSHDSDLIHTGTHPYIHMAIFWESMLLWDFLQDLTTLSYNIQNKSITNPYSNILPLPNEFDSPQQYKALWAPLLVHEAQAQILSDLDSSSSKDIFPVTVAAATRHTPFNHGVILNIKTTGYSGRHGIDYFINDILVFSSDRYALETALRGTQSANNSTTTTTPSSNLPSNSSSPFITQRTAIVALVIERSKTIDGLKILVSDTLFKTLTIPSCTEFYLLRLGSNVTAVREFLALSNFENMPLMKFVLKNQSVPKYTHPWSKNQIPYTRDITQDQDHLLTRGGKDGLGIGFRIYLNSKFNQSQKEAIIAAATEYGEGGFTLVKGPPGSGKTTTLLAIINALHLRQYQRYYSDVENVTAKCESIDCLETLDALMTSAKLKPRILVCAPSNAAVDNIVLKIMKDRFIDGNGGKYSPNIVRVGSGQSTSVSMVSLQTKVDSFLKECSNAHDLKISTENCQLELNRIESEIRNLQRRIRTLIESCPHKLGKEWEVRIDEDNFDTTGRVIFVNHKNKSVSLVCPSPPSLDEETIFIEDMPHYRSCMDILVKYVERRCNTCSKLDLLRLIFKAMGSDQVQSTDFLQQLETKIIDCTEIILTTLGSTGGRAMEFAKGFEVIIIDEAAQSSEMSSLMALALGSSHAVLVGDPNQLPATIFSMSGRLTKYDRSLFQRLEEAGHVVHMLNIQYRSHPKISSFPRRIFYEGSLLDGPNVLKPDYGGPLRKAIEMKFPNLQPLIIFDLNSIEDREHTNLSNIEEAYLALHIFTSLNDSTHGVLLDQRLVCIITPYSQQVSLLKKVFQSKLGQQISRGQIEINTVDAFQGNEREIVIFSAVRATNKGGGIGFLNDVKRMNVALTRAKHYLFIIARCDTILVNPYWRDLISYVRKQQGVLSVKRINPLSTISFPNLRDLEPSMGLKSRDDRSRGQKVIMTDNPKVKGVTKQAAVAKKQVLAMKFKRIFKS